MTNEKPAPDVARELLLAKLQDIFRDQKQWDDATLKSRISRMTDKQVYAALGMSESDMEPRPSTEGEPPEGSESMRFWYH